MRKLFGWFGGPGPTGTEAMMESIQMRPAKVHAVMAGVTEPVGGGPLAAGLATPLASAALTGVMTTAIKKVHLRQGPWVANGGWEYNAVLIAALAAMTEAGPGKFSLDHRLGTERSGTRWALAALGAGVATALLTMALGRRGAPALPPSGIDQPQDGNGPAAEGDSTPATVAPVSA